MFKFIIFASLSCMWACSMPQQMEEVIINQINKENLQCKAG